MIIEVIVILLLVVVAALVINGIESVSREDKISFKEAIDLTGLPIITFHINDRKLHFVLDTGASKSVLNAKIADKLGATKSGDSKIVGLDGTTKDCSYTTLDLTYKDTIYREKFQVVDVTETFREVKKMFGVTLHGVLGSSFMEKYKYVLDFKDMVVYQKK